MRRREFIRLLGGAIGSGFVASMARPAGNMTGFTIFPATITGKYLSILKEMVPQLARVAFLYNADYVGSFFLSPLVGAAREFKVRPITAQVRNPAEIESAIAKLGSEPRSGLIVMLDNFTLGASAADYLARSAVPYSRNLPLSVFCR
jgi:putative tryptophan/tyrosine transport system substrate-binding protein